MRSSASCELPHSTHAHVAGFPIEIYKVIFIRVYSACYAFEENSIAGDCWSVGAFEASEEEGSHYAIHRSTEAIPVKIYEIVDGKFLVAVGFYSNPPGRRGRQVFESDDL